MLMPILVSFQLSVASSKRSAALRTSNGISALRTAFPHFERHFRTSNSTSELRTALRTSHCTSTFAPPTSWLLSGRLLHPVRLGAAIARLVDGHDGVDVPHAGLDRFVAIAGRDDRLVDQGGQCRIAGLRAQHDVACE